VTTRRTFLASLMALPIVARFLPKKADPVPVKLEFAYSWFDHALDSEGVLLSRDELYMWETTAKGMDYTRRRARDLSLRRYARPPSRRAADVRQHLGAIDTIGPGMFFRFESSVSAERWLEKGFAAFAVPSPILGAPHWDCLRPSNLA